MRYIEGDILKIQEGIICHQVNCIGYMGAGIALGIKRKYYKVYDAYIKYVYKRNKDRTLLMGRVLLVNVNPKLGIANIFSQYNVCAYKQQTEYDYLREALIQLREMTKNSKRKIYIPYKMGCGLGGGDWSIVRDIIRSVLPDAVIVKNTK